MTRHIALGNGTVLVNVDKWLQLRDIYYPHVGQENHLLANANRFGIVEDKKTHWVNEDGWVRRVGYKKDTLVSDCSAINKNLQLEVKLNDCVHPTMDLFLRKIIVLNKSDQQRNLKVIFHHDFNLYGDGLGDTAGWDPTNTALFQYKRKRYFLVDLKHKGSKNHNDIHSYTVGQHGTSFEECKDGELSNNPIAQGKIDSALATNFTIKPNGKFEMYYWICMGRDFNEVMELDQKVLGIGPQKLILETEKYWVKWLKPKKLHGLNSEAEKLYKRSLLIMRTQIDNEGGIIAANDSDNIQFNKDTYSYIWPRDAGLCAIALQQAGYTTLTKKLYHFCKDLLSEAGCFLHKYNPDGSLGSSWHPYIQDGIPQLPIQEDSTALIIIAMHDFYKRTRKKQLLYDLYLPLIKPMANFLLMYRQKNTGLPRESYDLWEERRGILTFTAATVYGGLKSAAVLAKAIDDPDYVVYEKASQEVQNAIIDKLYDPQTKRFVRMINYAKGQIQADKTIESSTSAIFEYGVLPADDPKVVSTMEQIEEALTLKTNIGGIARYQGDYYYSVDDKLPGNPWVISTCWLGQWYIAKAKTKAELEKATKFIEWVCNNTLETGVMAEQIHPITGAALSVSPLTWSHAEYIRLVLNYSQKYQKLEK